MDQNNMYLPKDWQAHKIMLLVAFLFILINGVAPAVGMYALIPITILFVGYCYKSITNIILSAVIACALVLALFFSTQHPLTWYCLLMTVFYSIHIKHILAKPSVLMVSLYLWGLVFCLAIQDLITIYHSFASLYHWPFAKFLFNDNLGFMFLKGLILASVCTYIFHLLMTRLYAKGYTCQTALPLIMVVPLGFIFPIINWTKLFNLTYGKIKNFSLTIRDNLLAIIKSKPKAEELKTHRIILLITFCFILINALVPALGMYTLLPIGILFIRYYYKSIANVIISAIIALIIFLVLDCTTPDSLLLYYLSMIVFASLYFKQVLGKPALLLVSLYIFGMVFCMAIQDLLAMHHSFPTLYHWRFGRYFFYDHLVVMFYKGLILGIVFTAILDFLMKRLYLKGYTIQTALPTILTIPLGFIFPIINWLKIIKPFTLGEIKKSAKAILNHKPSAVDLRAIRLMLGFTFLFVLINRLWEDSGMWTIIPVICLFIYYAFKSALKISLIVGIAYLILNPFPDVMPFVYLTMFIIFLWRLRLVFRKWRPVLVGFYMYGISLYYALILPSSPAYTAYLSSDKPGLALLSAIITAALITFIFYCLIMWLLHYGYTMKTAMPIMGITPLLIILLCIPFIKIFKSTAPNSHLNSPNNFSYNGSGAKTISPAGSGIITPTAHKPSEHANELPLAKENNSK